MAPDVKGANPVSGPVLSRLPPIMPLIGLMFGAQSIYSLLQCSTFPASCGPSFSPCLIGCHAHAREAHGARVPYGTILQVPEPSMKRQEQSADPIIFCHF